MKDLGMDRPITRRDFLDGVGVALTGALVGVSPAAVFSSQEQERYPPRLTGMRGSHVGSWEVAHALANGRRWDSASDTGESYDLVVVGGGISGLSAAHFFRKLVGGPDARILILDNHDDFGGHAKRNELWHDGRVYLMNGGTLNVEAPSQYSPIAAGLLWELGIDRTRYYKAIEDVKSRYEDLGLSPGFFFDRETFGDDRLVPGYGRRPWAELVADTPLSPRARRDLVRLNETERKDPWPTLSSDQKKAKLARISYRDYLLEHLEIDPHVVEMYDSSGYLFVVGNDAVPALYAWEMGYPGFDGLGLEPTPPERLIAEPGGQHGRENQERAESGDPTMYFPDGNATITRLLVAELIPDAVPAKTMEDVVTAKADYSKLDVLGSPTRIRLDSTVTRVWHRGGPGSGRDVEVTYVNGGEAKRVRARGVVLACWNSVVPYLCPELPESQREALSYGVKAPLCYTNVLVSNWKSFVESGVSSVSAPGCFHQYVGLGRSLELGAYRSSQDPADPIVVRMTHYAKEPGLSRREQHRAGRHQLLTTSFERFEREIREQLNRTFSPKGFDAARDILAITVNRWPHGYTYTYNTLFDDPDWALGTPDDRPAIVGRKPFGRITIANADAAASPHTDAAINEAYRAVQELRERLG